MSVAKLRKSFGFAKRMEEKVVECCFLLQKVFENAIFTFTYTFHLYLTMLQLVSVVQVKSFTYTHLHQQFSLLCKKRLVISFSMLRLCFCIEFASKFNEFTS